VEFALAVPIIFLLIVVLLELGFALHSYVNVMAAAKDGARAGAIYRYQPDCDGDHSQLNDKALNDSNRQTGTGCTVPYAENIRASVLKALGGLPTSSPRFVATDPYYLSTTYDSTVGSSLDARKGQLLTVQVRYRHYWMTGFFNDSYVEYRSVAQAQIE
jgi:Flp pilus assembly protein TadG